MKLKHVVPTISEYKHLLLKINFKDSYCCLRFYYCTYTLMLLLSQKPYLHFGLAAVGKGIIRNKRERYFLIIVARFIV